MPASAWKADLDFLAQQLPKLHKNLFFKLPRKDFEAQVRRISESLPELPDVEVRTELARLAASVANGHTWIEAFRGSAVYPIRFRQFPEGFYAVAAIGEHRRAIGARLVGIGGLGIGDVEKRLVSLVPLETDLMSQTQLPGFLCLADALRGTRILTGTDRGEFRFEKDGGEFTLTIQSLAADRQGKLEDRPEGASYETPLYLSDRQTLYWFRYLGESRALYIQYNSCTEMKSLSFANFTKQVMETADRNPVDKVILDVRHNRGGNSQVIAPLIAALKHRPSLRKKGHLFVLTSPFTFSSGLLNALQFQRQLGAQMVGQPSAQRPNAYGDVRKFQLPNSGLTVAYATKFFRLAPGDSPVVQPDLPVELTARDYFSGRDPVLERVLR